MTLDWDDVGTDPGDLGAGGREEEKKKKPKAADVLVELAEEAEVFLTPAATPFARLRIDGHQEVWPVRSRPFRVWLARRFFEDQQTAPPNQAISDALTLVEARAHFDTVRREDVFLRVAGDVERIYIDLADEAWRAVEVVPGSFRVIDNPPVAFRRTRGKLFLPEPALEGSLELLRDFLNLGSDADWTLIASWIVAASLPWGPYPLLCFDGEQGSAKSTTCRLIRGAVDPNVSELRAEPKEARDLAIWCTNAWLVCLENVSRLQPWLSDSLCRLSTGGGFSTRKLYEDDEEFIFDGQRPVMLNGIEPVVGRPDLLDRALLITLPRIEDEDRREESELWDCYRSELPVITAGLFQTLADVLEELPAIHLKRKPRMADFARIGVATERALGWREGAFLSAYEANRAGANASAIESEAVGPLLVELLERRGSWEGSATELLEDIKARIPEDRKKDRAWPKTGRGMAGALRRLAPPLRRAGFTVDVGDKRDPKPIRLGRAR